MATPSTLPTPQQVWGDPDFVQLNPGEQAKVMRQIDPDFAGLAVPEQMNAVMSLRQRGSKAQTQPVPEGTISAVHNDGIQAQASDWLNKLESDVRHGGTETVVGRALHFMGARGTDMGVPESVSNQIASPVLGPIKTAQGVAEGNPLKTAGGLLQTATLPSAFAGPGAAETAINKIPSAKYGGQLINSVAKDANKLPVALDNASQAASKLMDWQQTTQLGPTINKFLNRITAPDKGPLTYEEARRFYQVLGRLSSGEANNLAPAVNRDLAQLMNGLRQDIGNTAAAAGRGDDYYEGMSNFAQAMKMKQAAAKVGKYVVAPAVAGAVGSKIYNLAVSH